MPLVSVYMKAVLINSSPRIKTAEARRDRRKGRKPAVGGVVNGRLVLLSSVKAPTVLILVLMSSTGVVGLSSLKGTLDMIGKIVAMNRPPNMVVAG